VSIPVYVRALKVLRSLIDKAKAYAKENDIAEEELIEARLIDDMYTFAG
jgi:uncharacterized protein